MGCAGGRLSCERRLAISLAFGIRNEVVSVYIRIPGLVPLMRDISCLTCSGGGNRIVWATKSSLSTYPTGHQAGQPPGSARTRKARFLDGTSACSVLGASSLPWDVYDHPLAYLKAPGIRDSVSGTVSQNVSSWVFARNKRRLWNAYSTFKEKKAVGNMQ